MADHSLADVREVAQQLRVDPIRCSTAAGSGHPTSSMSAADVMAVLLARHFHYDWEHLDNPANDHLIFSKGPLVLRSRMEGSSDEIDLVDHAARLTACDTDEDAFIQPVEVGGSGLDFG